MASDEELSRLAEAALLQEARRGAQRAETCGPSGWLRNRLPSANKRFLQNTILGALASNRVKDKKDRHRSETGKRKRELQEREQNRYKRVYLHASSKPKAVPEVKDLDTTKQTKVQNKSDKMMMWTEDGLELAANVPDSYKGGKKGTCKLKEKSKEKKDPLPRNIKFVSSSTK